MNGEILRPEKPNRIADIPRGEFERVVDKLAEVWLPRQPLERLVSDWSYLEKVVEFMRTGYDDSRKVAKAERDLQERRKHRRRLPHSGRGEDRIENFCRLAIDDSSSFVRIAAWSFVQMATQKQEGHSPVRQVFASEKLEALKKLIPPQKERGETKDAVSAIAGALAYTCGSAMKYASDPNGYREYAKETWHCGVYFRQNDQEKDQFGELLAVDPILFLQLVSVSFCKLLVGQNAKKICALYEFLKENYTLSHFHLSLEGCYEVDIGNVLHYYTAHAVEWISLQGSYPDPKAYYSLEFCCGDMKRLKDKPTHTHGTKGSLARGLARVLYKDKGADEEVWFSTCPFCSKALYTPPGAHLYDKEKDQGRLKVY